MIGFRVEKEGDLMESFEPKKLAMIRIWQILHEYSDCDHPLTQAAIASRLEQEYGIVLERKAIARNLSLLKEAGAEIESGRDGSYLSSRTFENAELHMLIDGVLSSKYITARHSKDLIGRISALSNRYFRAGIRNIHTVNDWSKTDNQALFYNIELIDEAIESGKQVHYDYNKYGVDKKLHKSSHQYVSPYRMLLHNQRYYLMAYSEYWKNMVFHRLDHMTNMALTEKKATPLRSVSGYKNGFGEKELSAALPYMYTDTPERIEFTADAKIVDQIIDWFGEDVRLSADPHDKAKVNVSLETSPRAMEHWAMQYIDHVEILSPESLREHIKVSLQKGLEKYSG